MERIHRREHRPWRPRMSDEHEFNPFVRSNEPGIRLDHQPFTDLESTFEETREQEAPPTPTRHS